MWKNIFKKFFEKKIFWKNFEKKIFWKKMSKNRVVPPRFFSHFFCIFFAFSWIKLQKNAKKWQKMAFFVIFSRFFKNVYSAYTPVFFAVKGGSHPGKNPPIYTVLNAAFSCAKTLCRGSQCTTRARPSGETKFFFRKNIFLLLPRIFVLTKFLKKI